jgi:hypothetical protein
MGDRMACFSFVFAKYTEVFLAAIEVQATYRLTIVVIQ